MRTVLIINTHSRQGSDLADKVINDFEKSDKYDIIKVILIEKIKKLDSYLSELKNTRNIDCVVVGSGDGTIVAVFNTLKRRPNIKYMLLPLGTSNTFVRSLGLPSSYGKIRKEFENYRVKSTPLGSINGVLFANIAGLGVPAHVSSDTSNKLKKYLGPLAYVVKGLSIFSSHKAIFCNITGDKINESFYTHYLLIANGPYHGPFPLHKDMSVFDKKLVLVAFGASSNKTSHIRGFIKFVFGKHEQDQDVKLVPFTNASLTTIPSQKIEADGEIIGTTPANIKLEKSAVKVFLPKKSAAPKRKKSKTRS